MWPEKYHVGDLVVCVVENGGDELVEGGPGVGAEGIVRVVRDGDYCPYGVEFTKRTPSMHQLNGRLDMPFGWWCTEDSLEFAELETDEDITVQNLDLIL